MIKNNRQNSVFFAFLQVILFFSFIRLHPRVFSGMTSRIFPAVIHRNWNRIWFCLCKALHHKPQKYNDMAVLKSINPYNQKLLEEFQELNDQQLNAKLKLSEVTFHEYRESSFHDRSERMSGAAEILRKEVRSFAETITREMGKPIKESLAEVEKCAWVCDFYAENAEKFLQTEIIANGC